MTWKKIRYKKSLVEALYRYEKQEDERKSRFFFRNFLRKILSQSQSEGVCLLVEGRGSRVTSRGSRVNGQGSRVKGRGSRVNGRGSRVNGRGSRVNGRGSRVNVEGRKILYNYF